MLFNLHMCVCVCKPLASAWALTRCRRSGQLSSPPSQHLTTHTKLGAAETPHVEEFCGKLQNNSRVLLRQLDIKPLILHEPSL